tara:strand:- start:32 stop:430 length:399 start_codon:yes stop_codon:yes gene_type:complete
MTENKMKSFLFLLLVFSFSAFSTEKILYCVTEDSYGFEPGQNYRQQQFTEERFTIAINFEEKTLFSEGIFFYDFSDAPILCTKSETHNYMACYSSFANASFKIFQENFKFVLTQAYGATDSIGISHGKCERF